MVRSRTDVISLLESLSKEKINLLTDLLQYKRTYIKLNNLSGSDVEFTQNTLLLFPTELCVHFIVSLNSVPMQNLLCCL